MLLLWFLDPGVGGAGLRPWPRFAPELSGGAQVAVVPSLLHRGACGAGARTTIGASDGLL